MEIGNWVRRPKGNGQKSKWHLVETIIGDDVVTRCGRRMPINRERYGGHLAVSLVEPLTRLIDQPQLCRYCV